MDSDRALLNGNYPFGGVFDGLRLYHFKPQLHNTARTAQAEIAGLFGRVEVINDLSYVIIKNVSLTMSASQAIILLSHLGYAVRATSQLRRQRHDSGSRGIGGGVGLLCGSTYKIARRTPIFVLGN
jgi:hypothetical protein